MPASGTAPASPATDSNWEYLYTGWTRRPLVRSKSNTALATLSQTYGATATSQKLYAQWVSETLDVDQTISGTVSMVVGKCGETSTSGDAHLAFSLRVVKPDGTFRGTLLLYHATSTEFPLIASAATRIHSARAITSLACLAGDRLVLEIGIHAVTPANEVMQMRFGDPSATADFALTAGLTTDLDPWMELSANLTFGTPTTPQAVDGSLSFSGAAGKYTRSVRTGALSFTGSAGKWTRAARAGVLAFSGALVRGKLSIKALAGAFSAAGAMVKRTMATRAGSLSVSGTVVKYSQVRRTGTLGFSGLAKKTTRILRAGALGFSGAASKYVRVLRAGILALSGAVARSATRLRALAGVLAFTGAAVGAKITANAISLAGSLAFSGSVRKFTRKTIRGTLAFAGYLLSLFMGLPLYFLNLIVPVDESIFVDGRASEGVALATTAEDVVELQTPVEEIVYLQCPPAGGPAW